MTYLLYNAVVRSLAPALALWLRAGRRHRALAARFAPPVPQLQARPLWVHACSVGEVNTARPLVRALHERFPDSPVLLTVSTSAGRALAEGMRGECATTWFPFDAPATVRRFVAEARPRVLILVETEIWPNVVRECRRAGVPVVVVNGRISDKHFARYARFRRFFREVFAYVSAAGVQDDEYARRIIALGAPAKAVTVTGSTKFDGAATHIDPRARARVRRENGFQQDDLVVVFGSTRPGDEALAAATWQALRDESPRLRLVVAPRHLDRLDEALAPFAEEPVLRRSAVLRGERPSGERVFFLDTVGELVQFYAIGDVAVVGGSFHPGVEGHNPIEPAALGVPTVFGPYMRNFAEPARILVTANAARRVLQPDELPDTLRALLRDGTARRTLGTRGRRAVLENQGAIARNVDLIAEALKAAET
ncbi:MAG TPA: glycosyltransferase N-terminal domain-containing protein [Candidatus Hydrogenedentes bacterium]|nr:glycosyltransferase N-terminal domain-containing protein [Candidatus Hydrogenedentota bacterium]